MRIQKIITAACLLVSMVWVSNVNAFQNGDIISFDPGVLGCTFPDPQICQLYGDYFLSVTEGSYFAVDLNGDGRFTPNERTPVAPGPDGGIIVGQVQPASGSHSGCPDGSENASVDQPWCFFGNTGMQQVTGTPVVDNGNGTLDFHGWGVTWNGIPSIPLGGDPVNFPQDTGLAELTCNQNPCHPGDNYAIDYYAHVPFGDASGFGGVHFQIHLESKTPVPTLIVSINVNGGTSQECASIGGNTVSASADVQLLNGAVLQSIQWNVDGQDVATGASISQYLTLGSHTVMATATGVSGAVDSESVNVTIVDTTAPSVTADFIDSRSGSVITTIDTKNTSFVAVSMMASDICDAGPAVSGVGGFALADGDLLKIQGNLDKVELTTSTLKMSVDANDASGNSSHLEKTLTITP